MKILRFGNSQDFVVDAAGLSRSDLLAQDLEAEFGEPVTVVTKQLWPNERMPGLMREWMEEEQPDVVLLNVTGYWFTYPSVPLKLKRRLGRFGVLLGDTGQQMADTPWLAHNRLFRAGRTLATRLIGGETNFTADEVIEVMTACIREVVRHEGVVVHMDGPGGRSRTAGLSRRQQRKMEARRLHVTHRLAEVCERYRVSFKAYEQPTWRADAAIPRSGDGLHYTPEGNARDRQRKLPDVVEAIRAARGMGAGR